MLEAFFSFLTVVELQTPPGKVYSDTEIKVKKIQNLEISMTQLSFSKGELNLLTGFLLVCTVLSEADDSALY